MHFSLKLELQVTSKTTSKNISWSYSFQEQYHSTRNLLKRSNLRVVRKTYKMMNKQESPPAWTQEAYRPPCSEYSFCCPDRVPPPPNLTGYPRGGTRTPPPGVPDRVPRGGGGGGGGTRTPRGVPDRVPPGGGGGGGYPDPPAASWHSGKCCKALWDMGTPPRCGQTNKVKLLPSRRTTYAGGNYLGTKRIVLDLVPRVISNWKYCKDECNRADVNNKVVCTQINV